MGGRSFGDLAGSNNKQTGGLGGAAISEIRRLLRLLAAGFSKRLDPDMEAFWVTRLDPLMGPALIEAMAELCDGEKFPTLKAIVDLQRAKAKQRASKDLPAETTITPEERKRSDHVAIQSMLWLHYHHPEKWPLSSFDGSIMARLFGGSPVEALTKAKDIYTQDELDRIMALRFEQIDREDSRRA